MHDVPRVPLLATGLSQSGRKRSHRRPRRSHCTQNRLQELRIRNLVQFPEGVDAQVPLLRFLKIAHCFHAPVTPVLHHQHHWLPLTNGCVLHKECQVFV